MSLTLISHFWNEEFLLPYWLRHHYPLFDRAILIDYASTDRSRDIIRELAPRWEVRPSRNQHFAAKEVDAEVMDIERECRGWKIALNTTEFLLAPNLRLFVRWTERYRPDVAGVWAFDFTMADPAEQRDAPVTDVPLHFQKRFGYHSTGVRSRLLHRNPDGQYTTGRHTSPVAPKIPDDSLFVLWFGWSPMHYVFQRKMQIQKRIPASDRAERLGVQHIVTPEQLEAAYRQESSRAYDLWSAHPAYNELIVELAAKAGVKL